MNGTDEIPRHVGRCKYTWGRMPWLVKCNRKEGHDGMHSGMSDGRKMVW